jgi:hypothetical protein
VALGRRGGKARAEGITAKRRKEIARKAAKLGGELCNLVDLRWYLRETGLLNTRPGAVHAGYSGNSGAVASCLPAIFIHPLSRAMQEGSYLADHMFDGESFLNNDLGRDIRGHIRRVGISTQIDLYCQRGDLPFVSAPVERISSQCHGPLGAIAHVCRTDDPQSFPEEAESRQDIRLVLQANLFRPADADLGKIIKSSSALCLGNFSRRSRRPSEPLVLLLSGRRSR